MNETIMSRGAVASATLPTEGHDHAVSWPAIFAGAAGSAALSLILLVLGVGLGMSSISPWAQQGASATTLGLSTILWLTLTALVASGIGGYIAGRLRTKWVGTHTDEAYFRDTAHGFIAWAVATLVTAAVLTSAIGGIVGSGVQAGAATAGAAGTAAIAAGGGAMVSAAKSQGDGGNGPGMAYYVDSLFRKDAAPGATADAGDATRSTSEMTSILAQGIRNGSLSQDDVRYAGQLIAQRTGIPQQDAEKRVTDLQAKMKATADEAAAKAKEAADKARKATAYASLWLFVSLLIGAFSASLAATYGGRRRDL